MTVAEGIEPMGIVAVAQSAQEKACLREISQLSSKWER